MAGKTCKKFQLYTLDRMLRSRLRKFYKKNPGVELWSHRKAEWGIGGEAGYADLYDELIDGGFDEDLSLGENTQILRDRITERYPELDNPDGESYREDYDEYEEYLEQQRIQFEEHEEYQERKWKKHYKE